MLCEHARKATTVHSSAEEVPPPIKGTEAVPGPYRGAPQGDQGCPSCTWAHQGVNITYPTRPWPLYSPPHQVLSLGLQDLPLALRDVGLAGVNCYSYLTRGVE